MSQSNLKDQLKFVGYDPEEAYFFEENRRKILDIRERIKAQKAFAEREALSLGGERQKSVSLPVRAGRPTKKAA